MKIYICKYDKNTQDAKVVYEEEITEEYRRTLIRLLENKTDIQLTMINENSGKK